MAKQRYIKDSFWTDPYIEKLSPDYKLMFLYLLTNPLANISGVYEIRLKRMAFETGYDTEVVENIISKFIKDGKIIQFESWIVITNHIKHQSLGELTAKGINREIQESPEEVQNLFEETEIVNSKGESYSVFVLKGNDKPLISPLQAPTFGALSIVKLNEVKLELPSWLNKDTWAQWEQHKKEKKSKLTKKAIELQLKMLSQNIPDHVEIIETSIRNGYHGLFPLKKDKKLFNKVDNNPRIKLPVFKPEENKDRGTKSMKELLEQNKPNFLK